MPETLRPDVFVEELQSQIQPIEGVGTTTGAFVGVAEKGPVDTPTLITGWEEFRRIFGNMYAAATAVGSYLAYEVLGFFQNGGKRCYVTRVAHRDVAGVLTALKASKTFNDQQTTPVLSITVSAKNEGVWGNKLGIKIVHNPKCSTTLAANAASSATSLSLTSVFGLTPGSEIKVAGATGTVAYARVKTVTPGNPGVVTLDAAIGANFLTGAVVTSEEFDLQVYDNNVLVETWKQLNIWESYNGAVNKNFVEAILNDEIYGSSYVTAAFNDANTSIWQRHPDQTNAVVLLTGGNDGLVSFADSDVIGSASIPSGLQALASFDDVNMVSIPGFSSSAVVDALATFATVTRVDVQCRSTAPSGSTPTTVMTYRQNTPGFTTHKLRLDFPWVEVPDPIGVGQNAKLFVPGDGHRMGMRVRLDLAAGVFHGGFGFEAQLRGVTDVQYKVKDAEHDLLNPLSINVTRAKLGRGIAVWGGRTTALLPEFRYENVVRTLMFFEESISEGLGWAVGSPNTEQLRERVRINIESFLFDRWKEGYLQGSSPREAYYVVADASNNPQSMINAGKLIVDIGVAIVRPVEFLVLRFVNWDGGRTVQELGLAA